MKDITTLIVASPIPSHPSTEIIDLVVASVRERLPDGEIIFLFDGIPADKMQYKQAYEEFKQKMLYKINEMDNAVPIVFDRWEHQSGMVREALKLVNTSAILFLEQDTPLHNDIPFEALLEPIKAGYCNTIRLHFEAQVHPEHEHLMIDHEPIDILGQPFLRTKQWSQRPHISSTKYYKHICDTYFDDQPRFIEHIMYGIISEGKNNYDEHRLHMYAPEGTLVRSLHLDGRRFKANEYDPSAS
jgi:hypothetical protein